MDGWWRLRARSFSIAAGIVTATSLLVAGCGSSGSTAPPAPSSQDALRTAQAATDALLNLERPFMTLGPITQHPYVCASADPCSPPEGYVSRTITLDGITNAQIAKFYIDNLDDSEWRLENAFCDEAKNQYVVVASKRTELNKSYPGRFELHADNTTESRITVPAAGAENRFTTLPAGAQYPTGTCSDTMQKSIDKAKTAATSRTRRATTTTSQGPGGTTGTTRP